MKTDRVKVLNQIDDIDARSQGAKIEMALIYGKGIPLDLCGCAGRCIAHSTMVKRAISLFMYCIRTKLLNFLFPCGGINVDKTNKTLRRYNFFRQYPIMFIATTVNIYCSLYQYIIIRYTLLYWYEYTQSTQRNHYSTVRIWSILIVGIVLHHRCRCNWKGFLRLRL